MQIIRDKEESGTMLILDDTNFVNCRFKNCTIMYHGGDFAFTNSIFDNCEIVLQGPAARTHLFMQTFGWKKPDNGHSIEATPSLKRLN
jgi:hypothetical protein